MNQYYVTNLLEDWRQGRLPAILRHLLLLATLVTVACDSDPSPPVASDNVILPPPTAITATEVEAGTGASAVATTATSVPPTPTPAAPLAARVNGEPILLETYERELARYEQAQADLGLTPDQEDVNYRVLVLEALIERELIAQAARAEGLVISPESVAQELLELQDAAGGVENFQAWLEANQWTEEEFMEALAAEMAAAQVRDRVTADVPETAEQVQARYIQVDDLALAQSLLDQLRNGADFAELARQHSLDRLTGDNGGDMGFFARGALLVPALEEAAFAQGLNEVSDVIGVEPGHGQPPTYYLIQTIGREEARPLPADMLFERLQSVFASWLEQQWSQAQIERLVNTEGA